MDTFVLIRADHCLLDPFSIHTSQVHTVSLLGKTKNLELSLENWEFIFWNICNNVFVVSFSLIPGRPLSVRVCTWENIGKKGVFKTKRRKRIFKLFVFKVEDQNGTTKTFRNCLVSFLHWQVSPFKPKSVCGSNSVGEGNYGWNLWNETKKVIQFSKVFLCCCLFD